MDTTLNVIAMLTATLLLAIAIDRGVPNSLDAVAYVVERIARELVALLRAGARRLRERHLAIERTERERLAHAQRLQREYVLLDEWPDGIGRIRLSGGEPAEVLTERR